MTARVAVVTGGSRGLGRAIALELGRGGWSVAVAFREREEAAAEVVSQLTGMGVRAFAHRVDVGMPDEVNAFFDVVDERLGSLDALVCAAGQIRDGLMLTDEPADLNHLLHTNVHGVVQCCRAAAKRMLSRRSGSLLVLSSSAAVRPGRGQSGYALTKGAVESFVRSLAVELAPRGIRVNAIAPGIFNTDMTAGVRMLAPEEVKQRVLLRRVGEPNEIAPLAALLCDERGSYITGQIFTVDGGLGLA